MTGLYVDRLDRLVEMGIYLDPQDAIRDSIRRTFRAYRMAPFYPESGEIEVEAAFAGASKIKFEMRPIEEKRATEELPEDVASS